MTIFSKIIHGEIPSFKVIENDYAYAFMDIMPLRKGHVLVVPKNEVDEIYDLGDKDYVELNLLAKEISKAMQKVFHKRIGYSVIGLEVPHAHIHLVPIDSANDLNFNQEKLRMGDEELSELATKIREVLLSSGVTNNYR